MKTLVAVPCMDMMHTQFVHSLFQMQPNEDQEVTFGVSSLIYDTRNQFIDKVLAGGYDRLFCVDSDMVFSRETVAYLTQDLNAGYDIVSALCFGRRPPIHPTAYKRCELVKLENGMLDPVSEWFEEYPKDKLFEVAAFGAACTMMNVDALRRIAGKYGKKLYSPMPGFGEDLSFCIRARMAGERLWVDSRAPVGHIGLKVYDEQEYRRQRDGES